MKKNIVIIGAGPSGLACGYHLVNRDSESSLVIIDKNKSVGGLSRSIKHKRFFFDIGPHRFYTKNKDINNLWHNLLGKNFHIVKRQTRILYKDTLFEYPIKASNIIQRLGIIILLQSFFSYISAKIKWIGKKPKTFEEWISKSFGETLYRIFFKTYTEKVWGIPCSEIDAKWASQRIKNLNFAEVILQNIPFGKKKQVKSLVEKFHYPRNGAGMMYEKMAEEILKNNATIELQSEVVEIYHQNKKITQVKYKKNGHTHTLPVKYLFSSMPITRFISALNPKPPSHIVRAANKLYFRDHITVNFIIKGPSTFKDQWIYIHSPQVKMSRVTNYNNFSNREAACYSLSVEYFAFKDDLLWRSSDQSLIHLAQQELEQSHLVDINKITDSFITREEDSYPTYYLGYETYFQKVKEYAESFVNLQLIGRGGMYKYNNMDHAMLSGMLAAENYVHSPASYDIWDINEESDYLEKI